MFKKDKWRPPSLSKLTTMVFNTGLTHLGSEASKSLSIMSIPTTLWIMNTHIKYLNKNLYLTLFIILKKYEKWERYIQ